MICECGATVSVRGFPAHRRGKAHKAAIEKERNALEQAARYRDWMIESALTSSKVQFINGPPELLTAGVKDAGARRVLDDYFLDRGVDLLELINELDFRIPEGLSPAAVRAAEIIIGVLRKNGDLNSGGVTVFWEPQAWQAHEGDRFEIAANLVVVYDGGSHRMYFEPVNKEQYAAAREMRQALEKAGCYFEPLSHFFGGIYCHDVSWQEQRNDRQSALRLEDRFHVGQRVVFTRDAEHYPHIFVPAGTYGTVEGVGQDSVDVYPDGYPREHHGVPDEWNGCFVYSVDVDEHETPPFEPIENPALPPAHRDRSRDPNTPEDEIRRAFENSGEAPEDPDANLEIEVDFLGEPPDGPQWHVRARWSEWSHDGTSNYERDYRVEEVEVAGGQWAFEFVEL